MLLSLLLITVLSVYDGDTLTINLPCNVAVVCNKIPLRLYGIDTPEINDARPGLKALAQKAKARLVDLVSPSHKVEVEIIGRDKYFRIDAVVYSDGIDVGKILVVEGLARPYLGNGPKPW